MISSYLCRKLNIVRKEMENILETTIDTDRYPGIQFDENGKPEGRTIVEIFDELEEEFVEFYGEYGRKLVNVHREEWNRQGPWHFNIF